MALPALPAEAVISPTRLIPFPSILRAPFSLPPLFLLLAPVPSHPYDSSLYRVIWDWCGTRAAPHAFTCPRRFKHQVLLPFSPFLNSYVCCHIQFIINNRKLLICSRPLNPTPPLLPYSSCLISHFAFPGPLYAFTPVRLIAHDLSRSGGLDWDREMDAVWGSVRGHWVLTSHRTLASPTADASSRYTVRLWWGLSEV